jgi:zinc transporter ZupT
MLCRSVIAVIVMIGIGSTTIPAGIAITLHLFNETHNASEVVSNINTSVGESMDKL